MAENKTRPEVGSPDDFLESIADDKRRVDAHALAKLMGEVTGEQPTMWGSSIVGYGTLHYRYESGREGDTPVVSFAPRTASLVLYGIAAHDVGGVLAAQLGPHTAGKGCLYIKDLSAVDNDVLARMIGVAYRAKAGLGS
ncbi:MAG: hypothetical protein QOH69_2445 [Actinomycetota bacterium]|nr:hypothetical protein [Actinomycetota bacterium]